jgi:hypothetical protein
MKLERWPKWALWVMWCMGVGVVCPACRKEGGFYRNGIFGKQWIWCERCEPWRKL